MKLLKRMSLVSAIVGAIATAWITGLTGASAATAKGELQKVRIGLDSHAFSLQFRVAQEKGIFRKYGIEPEISTFSYGIDTLNAATLNQVDTAIGMDYAVLTRLAKGDLKVAGLINSPRSNQQVLVVRGSINKPEDLKGKRLGVQRGTVNEYIWGKYFKKYHIDKKEVNLEPLLSFPETYAAFERGDIDGAWFSGTFIDRALKVQGAKKLVDLSAIDFRMRGFFVVQGELAKGKPEVVANILKALDEATAFISKNPEETADIAFKQLKLPKDGVLKELKTEWDYEVRFSKDDFSHLTSVKEWAVANKLLTQNYELKDKLALSPIQKALPKKVTYKP